MSFKSRGKKGGTSAKFVQSRLDTTPSTTPVLSADQRRIRTSTVYRELELAPSPAYEEREDLHSAAMADRVEGFNYLMDQDVPAQMDDSSNSDGIIVKTMPRNTNSDNPMYTWRSYINDFLDEVLRLDGPGDGDASCARCTTYPRRQALYRCCDEECFSLGLVCASCCAEFHATLPLHCIEKYNGTFFESCSLRDLGVSVQLGHPAGTPCPSPRTTTPEFAVIHSNGIHVVDLRFCGCTTAAPFFVQLLRNSWWPATPLEPRTATTFGLLRLFHYLNTLGKLPVWDMWKAVQAMTEGRMQTPPPDRYKVLLRTTRQWRHIKMLKRAGRGNDPTGSGGTGNGELALACPACPHPGINLPANWRDDSNSYKYRLFIAVDGNFRTRNAMVSTVERDPPLADGSAYFTPGHEYQSHIRNFVNQDDMSSCSGFQAMFLANLKNVRGLRTTGVVGVTCGRHGLWRPNGMGDLQRGERYCNVDPLVSATLKASEDLEIVISYDIVCQWSANFWQRVAELPDHYRPRLEPSRVVFCIPKFHLWAHKVACHALYSFNYLIGAGRTHSETVEGNWSQSNRAAAQTKMMGPGARHDTLNDIWGMHNYQTIQAFGRVLAKRLVEAVKEANIHRKEFSDFNRGMLVFVGASVLEGWDTEVLAWEHDHSAPCPYQPNLQRRDTLQDVELQLLQEERESYQQTGGVAQESSMALFLTTCIDAEDQARDLAWEIKARRSGTTYQELNIEKQRAAIGRIIRKIRGLQHIFMPHLREFLTAQQLVHIDNPASIAAEETKLFLPSELRKSDRNLPRACVPGLVDAEIRLREAQCRDALESLRQGLRTRSAAHHWTVRNITGQNPTTRAEAVQRKIQINVQRAKLRYRWARNALYRLRGHGDWERELQVLEEKDVRGMNERMLTAEEEAERSRLRDAGILDELVTAPSNADAVVARGEGRRQLSWIWYSYHIEDAVGTPDDPSVHEALKIEWCKARARKLRWEEEVVLLLEEMRRVIAYKRWKSDWWTQRVNLRQDISPELMSGVNAFAMSQAAREHTASSKLEERWATIRGLGEAFLSGTAVEATITIEVDSDNRVDEEDVYDDIE